MKLAARLAAFAAALAAKCALATSFSVGVVPQFPAIEIARAWQPLLERLGSVTGHRFELQVPTSIPAMEEGFSAGRFDFIFVNPYHAVMARRAQGYVPIVRAGDAGLSGVLVVRADSPVKSIEDLRGKRIAFPAPNAFGASLYLRALLTERHHVEFEADYVKTHSNAYRAVMLGQALAAGGVRGTLAREPLDLQHGLRVLYETPAVASHPLAAHPRVAESVRERLAVVLMSIASDEAGRGLLASVQLAQPVRASYQRDYQSLEILGLDRHVVASH